MTRADEEDLASFVQRNVQAAVDAATARDLSASGGPSVEASLAGSVRSLRLTGADHGSTGAELPAEQARSCPGAGQDPEPDCATSQAPGSSAADPLNVPGQPQVAVRLHKARIKIPSLGLEGKFVEAAVSQRGSTTLQALERDLEAARAQIKVKSTEAREAQEELRAFRSERTSASKANRALEGQIARLQKQVDGLKGQVAARDVALKQAGEAAGERERGQREAEGHLQSRSARLNRALEEVQRYRKLLEEAKQREQSQQSVAQSEHHRVLAANKQLERQRSELLAAFKKQLKLVDLLKRQKVHMEAARMLQFTEDEFIAALETPAAAF